MATDLQLTDELDAVNAMLDLIGEAPLNSVTTPGTLTGVKAKNALRRTNRTVQSRGWHWNSEVDWPLSLSVPDGFLYVPSDTLKIDAATGYKEYDVVHRGSRLYDRENHTYVFTKALKADLVVFLPFTDLPQTARDYITIRAGRSFAASYIGDVDTVGFTERDMFDAWQALLEAEDDTEVVNVLTQNWSTYRVLER